MVLEILREVLTSEYRGPRAVFTEVHVLKALVAIGGAGSVGRGRLGALTGLGQGEVRTLIKRMKDNQLISIEANGCRLSSRGEREYRRISELLAWSGPTDVGPLEIGRRGWAIVVRRAAGRVRYGIEQRDAAIKAGAEGAFTAVFSAGRFLIAGEKTDCEADGPNEPWKSVRAAPLREGDVVVAVGAGSEREAEDGALAAALTII